MIVSYIMAREDGRWMIAGMDLHTVRGVLISNQSRERESSAASDAQ
jgi:hypothetical protein